MGKTPQSTEGFFMNVTDPEGNRFGIYEFIGRKQ
jgi:predicted enzyme related to lactoylglutathione lyase